jgi:hypothetical protein
MCNFHDLADKLGMPVEHVMRIKPAVMHPSSQALVKGLAQELETHERFLEKIVELVRRI